MKVRDWLWIMLPVFSPELFSNIPSICIWFYMLAVKANYDKTEKTTNFHLSNPFFPCWVARGGRVLRPVPAALGLEPGFNTFPATSTPSQIFAFVLLFVTGQTTIRKKTLHL